MEVIMTKIMLVEDDKSLREIYGVRLLAEGYEIISAGDGEEALAMAVKEKPDLILSDVMMPKISGFDMLDILRSTPETKDIKVIMMTALSSEDQRSRGETLGANRYLVKSQVGIEDVVRTVHDMLGDVPVAAAPLVQKFGNPVPTEVVEQTAQAPPVSLQPQDTPKTEATIQPETDAKIVPEPITAPVPVVEPVDLPTPAPAEPANQPDPAPEMTSQLQVEPLPTIPAAVPAPEPQPEPTLHPAEPEQQPPVTPAQPVPTPEPITTPQPQDIPTPTNPITPPVIPEPTPEAPTRLPEPTAPFSTAAPPSLGERVINPPSPEEKPKPDISTMINQELGANDNPNPQSQPPAAP